ncbi:MAG: hydroxymethylglutaryl-CoA lyase [Limnobacter sp.]|nr:hydroxymethylglutaryl-CoA lyase [Limnobacter sp.]
MNKPPGKAANQAPGTTTGQQVKRVSVVEVSPRDGLQNETQHVPTPGKVELCELLLAAGVLRLEATAFVSPRWVPQMADASAVLGQINRGASPQPAQVCLSALVPNLQGLHAALAAGVQEVVVFTAASEAFTQQNIHCTIAQSIERFKPVVELARQRGVHVRASISCALGCPYQGAVPADAVAQVARQLLDLGITELDVADTIGVGTAGRVQEVFERVAAVTGVQALAAHFHDTYGQALTNVYAALGVGVRTFHSSVAGLGGCPYAQGATGNLATEDLVYLLHGLGYHTGLDLPSLARTGQWVSRILGRRNASRVGCALEAAQLAERLQ